MATLLKNRAEENLYLPGVNPETGMPRTLVEIPGIWGKFSTDQRRGGPGELYMSEVLKHAKESLPCAGVFVTDRISKATGKVIDRVIHHNVETDNGIRALLSIFGSGGANLLGQYIMVSQETMTTTLTSSATGSTSSLAVAAWVNGTAVDALNAAKTFKSNSTNSGPANPDSVTGSGIIISFGLATKEYAIGSATQASGTAIAITTETLAQTHAIGDYVVAGPSTADAPTSVTGAPYNPGFSSAQAATYGIGTGGIGQRTAVLQFTWNAGVLTAGTYDAIWIVSASGTGTWVAGTVSAGTNSAYAHTVSSPLVVNSSIGLTVKYTATF